MVIRRGLKGTCMQLSRIFRILMIRMGMKSKKTNLKISSNISPSHLRRSATISNEVGWRSLLVVRRQSYRLSRLTCLTRAFSYSVCSTPRGVTIQWFLAGMVKMLESKAVEVIEDLEPEAEVDDKSTLLYRHLTHILRYQTPWNWLLEKDLQGIVHIRWSQESRGPHNRQRRY